MLRNLLVLFPAVALALPVVAAAKPLTTQVEESSYKPGKKPGKKPGQPEQPGGQPGAQPGGQPGEQPGEQPGGQPGGQPGTGGGSGDESTDSRELELDFCATAKGLAEDRACDLQIGEVCLAACDWGADDVAACRSACTDEGALFCATRYKPGKKPGKKPSKPGTPPTEPGGTPPTEPGGTTPTEPGGVTPTDPGGVNPDESEQPVTPGAAPEEDDGLVFIDVARCATLGVIVDG